MISPYGVPERTTVVKDGVTWTVSTIRDGLESIAFEEVPRGRQIEIHASSHAEAVERFTAERYPGEQAAKEAVARGDWQEA
jgi:hypothetical protein